MSDYDDDDEVPCCDWCDKETKIRSLVMGYTDGMEGPDSKWGKGDMLCGKCLKELKPKLYRVKYHGRNMYATKYYYEKYWKNESAVKVLQAPGSTTKKTTTSAGGAVSKAKQAIRAQNPPRPKRPSNKFVS
mmetsp:Transcript_19331/g.28605  ORF Transcript_19331/g.28605 Transcript_19331/m.28605 type:complete len:131 (+) Transcript_19331:87-479(+)|eukprot:CAMPEP_0194252604 /NCGR_PEP_ID=MMETSP0158-20130606/27989_1 /TAXON_ID=33649 /ORGANISM="Thalassionema nitzschioides, Strain L26-B" /LENGTH=130 /DNA_ID=CAMNT_0038990053 /DNA_START=133 /DNA_END=525 /DNA_ORIENTATION=+